MTVVCILWAVYSESECLTRTLCYREYGTDSYSITVYALQLTVVLTQLQLINSWNSWMKTELGSHTHTSQQWYDSDVSQR